ncbi:MAG: hypothetical protein QM679_04485 [Patulibacter sp.]
MFRRLQSRGIRTIFATALFVGLSGVAAPAYAAAAPAGSVLFDGYETAGAVPTGLHVRVNVADDDSGLPPLLRRVDLDLPAGFQLGPQAASRPGGLTFCTAAQFAAAAASHAECAADTQVGVAQLDAPELTAPHTGRIYLGSPTATGGLPTVNIEVSDGGSDAADARREKLVGQLRGDASGRLTVSFDQIPQVAFSDLDLTLDGGPSALLVTPGACGAAAGLVTFTSAVDGSTGSAAGATTIGPDCGSSQIDASLTLSSDNPAAGSESAVRGTLSLADRGPALTGATIHLPPGLLAHIGDVAECSLAVAAAGQCGSDSRIGTISAVVGAGPSPITVGGTIYIVPRSPGAVAGIAAVIDARLGDLDLGRLVLGGDFILRPTDAGLNLQMSAPTTYAGVGLFVRAVTLAIDRDGFAVNPSTCGPLGYDGAITATGGATTTVSNEISYAGCAALPFAPTLTAALGGETAPLGHPNITVGLNARAGDSNLQAATVTLPSGIGADPANLQNACDRSVFDAGACSATARVGTATARVGLTPEPVPGDVYLVKIPGSQLPGLGLSFTGRYTQRVLASIKVDSGQRLVVKFDPIPDLPLRRLDLTIIGGSQGPIRVAAGKCVDGGVWDASFRGQGGQISSHTIPAPCPPTAAKRASVTLSSKRGLSVRLTDLGGRSLHSMKVTLPSGYSFNKGRAGNAHFRSLATNGGKATIKTTTRTVQVFPKTKTTTKLTLKLRQGTVLRAARLGTKARTAIVEVRLAFTDGTVQRQRIRLRAS